MVAQLTDLEVIFRFIGKLISYAAIAFILYVVWKHYRGGGRPLGKLTKTAAWICASLMFIVGLVILLFSFLAAYGDNPFNILTLLFTSLAIGLMLSAILLLLTAYGKIFRKE